MSVERRRTMIEPAHPGLSIVRQSALLQLSRSGRYYRPTGETAATLTLMRLIDEAFLECPYYGSRQMMRHLQRLGRRVSRNRVGRLMRKMGLRAIYQKPNTSAPHPEHRIYSYLLRDLPIVRPNQVWCTDITYIPMRRGFLYLVGKRQPIPTFHGFDVTCDTTGPVQNVGIGENGRGVIRGA